MVSRNTVERVALFICLPLLLLVSFATWKLWQHGEDLNRSLAESTQVQIDLLAKVRDAVGREELAGKALNQVLLDLEATETERDQARDDAKVAQTEAERQARLAARLKRQRAAELDRMAAVLAKIAPTEREPIGMVVRLSEDAFKFEFDKAELMPGNREILSRIAGVLLASYGYRVIVYGHTDRQGPAAYNLRLSERRAEAVRAYLEEAGLPPAILQAEGRGESSLRVKGDSPEAHQENRRVEIAITDTVIEYTEEVSAGAR